jgi:hypothetical protein
MLAVGVSGLATEGLLRPEARLFSGKTSSSGTSPAGLMAAQGRGALPSAGSQHTEDESTAMGWRVERLRTRMTS